jgi:tetratricopeptide (TPR) repeat protein
MRIRAAAMGAAVVSLLAIGRCLAAGEGSPDQAGGRSTKELVRAGVAALEEANFSRAEARFREAAGIDPSLPQARLGLGLALTGARDRKGAERALREAIDLSRGAVEARYALGVASFVFGDLRGAAEELRAAGAADHYFIEARYASGVVAAARGDLAGSAAFLREALRVDASHAASHYQLGAVLARSGDLDGALQELARALAIDPVILDARPEDPLIFGVRSVRSTASESLGLPLPTLRPSILWARPRPGTGDGEASIPEWSLFYAMALDLGGAGEWRGAADMLERALLYKDRSEAGAIMGDRLMDYFPHLRLAEAYQHLGNSREASLHAGIARNEGNAPPEELRALELLIMKDRLRPRIYLQPLPDRTTEEAVKIRGLVVADEPVARVDVGGREAILRPATGADLSALLPAGEPAVPRDAAAAMVFEVSAFRLRDLGDNVIPIQPTFQNPSRDGDRLEVMVVRLPPPAPAAPSRRPSPGAP